MEKELRIKKLAEIKSKGEAYMTGLPGEVKNFDAYKSIRSKYLIYNRQVPIKQIFALYAINKISSIANGE